MASGTAGKCPLLVHTPLLFVVVVKKNIVLFLFEHFSAVQCLTFGFSRSKLGVKTLVKKIKDAHPDWDIDCRRVREGLLEISRQRHCANCASTEAIFFCTGCDEDSRPYYCSAICQTSHWQFHRKVCNKAGPSQTVSSQEPGSLASDRQSTSSPPTDSNSDNVGSAGGGGGGGGGGSSNGSVCPQCSYAACVCKEPPTCKDTPIHVVRVAKLKYLLYVHVIYTCRLGVPRKYD